MRRTLSLFLLLMSLAAPLAARERSEVPDNLKWDLTEIYPDRDTWSSARDALATRIPQLEKHKGHLSDSPEALANALADILATQKELDRLYAYAMFVSDQDTRVSANLELQQSAQQLGVQFAAAKAFFRPELLQVGKARVDSFIASNQKLKVYQQLFDDIFRLAPHTLSTAEERIVARAHNLEDSGAATYGIFTNADLPYPEVTLSNGEKVRLDAAGFTRYRGTPNREDRRKVFQAFFGRYSEFTRTLGTTLYAQVKAHLFEMSVRQYESSLQAALFADNIPPAVYHQLVTDVHANLPTLHRYLKLRQQLMGVERLRYDDLYAPIIKGVDIRYTPEQAKALTHAAVAPLGADYQQTLQRVFDERWVDFLPTTGKRSGAYSEGAVYDVHPYQLLNFNGEYTDVSTLAHELGHSMHSYLSNRHQPFGLHSYATFVAEVASTLNENLLLHHMLANTQDDETRLYLLGSYLENMRQTLFRQVLFAEFELRIHELAESGQTLTGENMTELYLGLLREYYGHDQGICEVDEVYGVEWAYIPHFYYNFYVYQYATSLVASTSLAVSIRDGKPGAREAYLKMLSSGASAYPIDELKAAGVDMTTSRPFQAAMAEMNHIMDQIEEIRARKS
ncbi:MAG: oligoendopeptidase F [Vulcanimicrobiota bacterium]